MGLFSSIFNGKSLNDKGCDWYCDNCGKYMNSQPGFTTSSDEWTCTACGYINDVSEYNIQDDDDDDDKPELCEACGGPYPHCMASCDRLDD